eukprot:scaffold240804_cov13-Prasinocladus_malaysianus.AAC.1
MPSRILVGSPSPWSFLAAATAILPWLPDSRHQPDTGTTDPAPLLMFPAWPSEQPLVAALVDGGPLAVRARHDLLVRPELGARGGAVELAGPELDVVAVQLGGVVAVQAVGVAARHP